MNRFANSKPFFIISHYEKMFIIIMPVRVDKISVDFGPYAETNMVLTRKCYRCKQVKDIDCFKRVYIASKKHYNNCSVKYTLTCSECLNKSSLKG